MLAVTELAPKPHERASASRLRNLNAHRHTTSREPAIDKLYDVVPSPTRFRSLFPSTNIPWKFTFGLLLTLTLLHLHLARTSTSHAPSRPPLLLPSSKTFKIVIFEDLHFGEAESTARGPSQDRATLRLMRSVLAAEAPDLVVLNGDLVTGGDTFRENSTSYVDLLVQPMVEARVPWASAYGNHDSRLNLSREAIFETETKYHLSLTSRPDDPSLPGLTNYFLPIAHRPDTGRPSAILWFFDSRGGRKSLEAGGTGRVGDEGDLIDKWVGPQTASWFLTTHALLAREHGRVLPSLAFVHIPTRSYLPAQDRISASFAPGMNHNDPADTQSNDPSPAHPAAAFVAALGSVEGLHSVHAAHNHGNDWCAPFDMRRGAKPFLCFGRHTGYGGFGGWTRGARVLELQFHESGEVALGPGEGMEVETWIRLEGGDVVGRVSLNETYGVDEYPVTEE
ncbi:related to DNA repair exonuclease SIA1 [Cephalotrichum gorgonifer]|uniref:Related to DNA repair exonuclease SIA1 n=1 Tax=Cephalotrichum gorgonifer TaxID=2041049 RepID=A0AAE8N192_9PEZI|nr:related to DNA repair exonuclease SIA1 [Cephalotrichum gorgonifer]